jgi:DNA-binding transcriptional LysR family regulator
MLRVFDGAITADTQMNLRHIDLNLLVAFDALLKTRHVTRAAEMLGIGQPAMSATLSRMRQAFGDQILVKQGGDMLPTARALELQPDVRRILRDVELLLTEEQGFDAAKSKRLFAVRMSDLLSVLILPELARRLGKEAPGLRLDVVHLGPEATVDALERGEIELAVSTNLKVPKSIETAAAFQDRVVCMSRRGHPQSGKFRSLETFLWLPQIKVAQSPIDDRFADRQLAELGHRRTVSMTVPHWLSVPDIVANSDLVSVMPASVADRFAGDRRIQIWDPPLKVSAFDWKIYWHRRHASDRGHQWLRQRLAEITAPMSP